MALNPKDRERIIEEETLRYETRRKLEMEHCGTKHGYGSHRWGFWKVLFTVLIILCVVKCISHGHGKGCWGHGSGYGYNGCYDQMQGGSEGPEINEPEKDMKVLPKKK